LPGIAASLDYVASLGVDAVWLSPFFTSPMKDFGYDVSDYCDVDPIFGTLQDFDRLLQKAHGLGLKIVIDQVFSHTSDQHPWFRESSQDRSNARADWYVWADPKVDGSPPTNWQSVFGGPAWTWNARRGQYYLHNFLTEQPDLNVHDPQVQEALLKCARFWFERGVDGFRLDAVNFTLHDPLLRDNPPAPPSGQPRTRPVDFQLAVYNKSHPDLPRFIERIRRVADEYGGRFTVAEIGGEGSEPERQLLTQGHARFHTAYGFNFLYADRLTPELVRTALEAWPDTQGMGWPSWAFSNHDAPRAVTRWSTPEHRTAYAQLAMLLLMSLRGNIFLYQGEELGLPQAHIDFATARARPCPGSLQNRMPGSRQAHRGFRSVQSTLHSPWIVRSMSLIRNSRSRVGSSGCAAAAPCCATVRSALLTRRRIFWCSSAVWPASGFCVRST
jgi:alpha-glucosidase